VLEEHERGHFCPNAAHRPRRLERLKNSDTPLDDKRDSPSLEAARGPSEENVIAASLVVLSAGRKITVVARGVRGGALSQGLGFKWAVNVPIGSESGHWEGDIAQHYQIAQNATVFLSLHFLQRLSPRTTAVQVLS